jgi:hypothetical protein
MAITAVSQFQFLKDDSSKPHESSLNNLQGSAELYERLAQGKQISVREEREVFALSNLFDGFEQKLDSPRSIFTSAFSQVKSYNTFDDCLITSLPLLVTLLFI